MAGSKFFLLMLMIVGLIPAAGSSSVGIIDTFAGNGIAGSAGDGGSALAAALNQPFHCEIDPNGHLLIADAAAGKIRKVDRTTGIISTVAGNGSNEPSLDGSAALVSSIGTPYAIAADRNGDLYIVDQKNPVVRKLDGRTGLVSVVAGTGVKGFGGDGGPATRAMLREPNDCCLDGTGGLLIADVADGRVRRVDLKTGIISTFAGKGKPIPNVKASKTADADRATTAILNGPRGVCVDRRGNTFVCEREGNAIRKVDESGKISTIAGTGAPGYAGDGSDAKLAKFRGPKGIRADADGNLYVVDTENHAIRKIDVKSGVITTVAGGRQGGGGDGQDATRAGLARPHGCVIAQDGTIYIADSENHRVRRVVTKE